VSADFLAEDDEEAITENINLLTEVVSNVQIYIRQESPSSNGAVPENVLDLRINAPRTFNMQGALNSISDYANFFAQNYRDLIHDIYTMNNWEYMTTYMAEYFRTGGYGIEDPNIVKVLGGFRSTKANILQMDSVDFNNIYVVAVPNVGDSLAHPVRERMVREMRPIRNTCTEIIIIDPVYTYILPYVIVKKDADVIVADAVIEAQIANIIRDYFQLANNTLGRFIEVSVLKQRILEIKGVDSLIYMNVFYKDNSEFTESEVNEIILDDYTAIQDQGLLYDGKNYDYQLLKFKFPRLSEAFEESLNSLVKGIKVTSNTVDTLGYTEY
jgi:hypothetical protein